MRGAVSGRERTVTVVRDRRILGAMAASSGASMAALVRHTGAGVARRDAYHERRSVEWAELEEVDVDDLLAVEQRGDVIVRVEAGTIVVEADGPNYTPHVKHERKKARRARQQEAARQKQAAAADAEAEAEAKAEAEDAEAEAEAEAEASGEKSASPVARGAFNGMLTVVETHTRKTI